MASGRPPARAGGPGEDGRPAGAVRAADGDACTPGAKATTAATAGRGGARLTGRGALLGMFGLCLLGVFASGWLGWGPLAGGAFVAATVLAAAWTQRTDLLTVSVSPPALFLAAVVCVKGLTASGNVLLSTATGTLITLANTAPWLLAGTALNLFIAFTRGLRGNVAALGREMRGDPAGSAGSPESLRAGQPPARR